MGYQWSETYGWPTFNTYADVLDHWNNTAPWRGEPETNKRPLSSKRRRRQCEFQLHSDGDITCFCESEPLVRWHPNGDISLKAVNTYGQHRYNTMFDSATPERMYAMLGEDAVVSIPTNNEEESGRWRRPQKLYSLMVDRFTRFSPSDGKFAWEPHVETLMPFVRPVIDRKKSAALRDEFGFSDFTAWIRATFALKGCVVEVPSHYYGWRAPQATHEIRSNGLLEYLTDKSRWPEVHASYANAALAISDMTEALYKEYGSGIWSAEITDSYEESIGYMLWQRLGKDRAKMRDYTGAATAVYLAKEDIQKSRGWRQ